MGAWSVERGARERGAWSAGAQQRRCGRRMEAPSGVEREARLTFEPQVRSTREEVGGGSQPHEHLHGFGVAVGRSTASAPTSAGPRGWICQPAGRVLVCDWTMTMPVIVTV